MRHLLPILFLAACAGDTEDKPTDTDTDAPPDTGTPVVEPPPRCVPEVSLPSVDIVEGDSWEVTWACAGTVAPQSEFVPTLVGAPDGVSFDPSTWTASATTDLDDAGTVELFLSVAHTTGGVPETSLAELYITDAGPGVAGNSPVDPLTYRREFGLPVVHLFPSGPVTDVPGAAVVVVGGEEQPFAQAQLLDTRSGQFPKPSYTLTSEDSDQFDLDDLDLGRRGHLTLLSTFADNSRVRQKLSFDLWEDIADHLNAVDRPAPHASFVVVYLDGEYHGLYVGIDHIDGEYFAEFGLDELGNVYRSVSDDANFARVLANGQPKVDLTAGWEKREGLPAQDTTDLQGLTAFVADRDPTTFWADAPAQLDVEAFMDWFLLVSFASASDSAADNAWLYNDIGQGVFHFTPWGFDHSWGQSELTARVPVTVLDDFQQTNLVFSHLQSDPLAATNLWGRYASLAQPGAPLSAEHLADRLDDYWATIEHSARRDEDVWAADYAAFPTWSGRPDLTDLDGEWAYLRSWAADRPAEFASLSPL